MWYEQTVHTTKKHDENWACSLLYPRKECGAAATHLLIALLTWGHFPLHITKQAEKFAQQG